MSGMMEDVLLLGRFESGMQKFNPEELHLAAWSRRFVDEMQSATGARCPLHLEVGEFPAIVLADESLLRHILANLVANAAKYSDPGTPVKINITREGGDAVFRVEDHQVALVGCLVVHDVEQPTGVLTVAIGVGRCASTSLAWSPASAPTASFALSSTWVCSAGSTSNVALLSGAE